VNRGDLWTVAGGVYASKPRPVLIIQVVDAGTPEAPASSFWVSCRLIRQCPGLLTATV